MENKNSHSMIATREIDIIVIAKALNLDAERTVKQVFEAGNESEKDS